MSNKLKVKYGVFGAAILIVGTIIGSGIFTKTRSILQATQGNTSAAILAWVIGSISTILGVLLVNEIASKEIKTGGMQTYAESAWGKIFGYVVGFSETFLYVPSTLVILSYYAVLQVYKILDIDVSSINIWITVIWIALVMIFHIVVNMFSTLLTKILSYGALLIKLLPIAIIVIFSIINKPNLPTEFKTIVTTPSSISTNWGEIFSLATNGLVGVMFAFEGWIYIGTISQEIKDAKKNVPIALILGTGFVAVVYILFTLASLHVIPGNIWANEKIDVDTGSVVNALFGPNLAKTLNVAILISIIGGLNGFAIISIRLPYALAIRNQIIGSKYLKKVSNFANIPFNSGVVMLITSLLWLFIAAIFGIYIRLDNTSDIYTNFSNVMDSWIANMPVAIFWLFYCIIFVGAFKYRYNNRKEKSEGFQLPLFVNIIFVIFACFGGILVIKSSIIDSMDGLNIFKINWNINGLYSLLFGLIITAFSFVFIPFIKNFCKEDVLEEV